MSNEFIKSNYFAAKDASETTKIVLSKAEGWFSEMEVNGYLNKLKQMWMAYHGCHFADFNESHQVQFSGEQGELVNLAVNHMRNLSEHMINMITATRPAMEARAVNTDSKSLMQAKLANGLLDYYMREKRLENYLKRAVEYAVVLGSGYVKLEWNATIGELYEVIDGFEIREGDIEFSNLSPFDVMFDSSREDDNHDWVLCRSFKNRYDLAAKYPEFEDKIKQLPSKAELQGINGSNVQKDDTDLIPIYEFYHKRSEALPDGRYILFLSDDVTLLDSPMPYRALPVYRIAPANILGTPYGYTPMFDVLPIQDAVNSLYSTILTNQSAFGVQSLVVPRNADVNIESLSEGLSIIEMNTQFGEIKPLQLTSTPPEVFNFLKMLENAMETISGINSVTRGQPDPSLKSGNALALIQSMAVQFISRLQHSYVAMVEDMGTGIINCLKDHANTPRVKEIVGLSNVSYLKSFTGDDLESVNRVIVDIGNPMARTTAGRVQMAEQMLQMGIIKEPRQYFSVINTGRLDVMTDDTQSQLLLAKAENERMVSNQEVMAVFTDEHALHIQEHSTVLSDPELRFDQAVFQRVSSHIQEHIDLLRNTDPALLGILKQQPLGPAGGTPPNPETMEGPQPPDSSMDGAMPTVMGGQQAPTVVDQQGAAPQNLPQPAQPPGGPESGLTTDPAQNLVQQ